MALDVADALRRGVGRATSRDAVPIALAYVAVQVLSTVAVQSQGAAVADTDDPLLADTALLPEGGPLAVDLPLSAISALSFLSIALLSLVTVVALRTFVADVGAEPDADSAEVAGTDAGVETDTDAKGDAGTDAAVGSDTDATSGGLVLPTLWGVVALLTFPLVFALGIAALVVPGILFAVTMAFVPVFVAVDDDNLLGAMVDSWRLTRGNWLRVLLLLAAEFGVVLVVALVGAIPATVATVVDPAAGTVLQSAFGGVSLTVVVAVLAAAFVQLREADGTDGAADEDDPLADIDDELLP